MCKLPRAALIGQQRGDVVVGEPSGFQVFNDIARLHLIARYTKY
jgi:hypothetical protein